MVLRYGILWLVGYGRYLLCTVLRYVPVQYYYSSTRYFRILRKVFSIFSF